MTTETRAISHSPGKANYLGWIVALLAAYVIYSGTPWGPGLTPDAVAYVHSAGLLRDGWRLMQLPSNWPPGYPLVLALGEGVSGDLMVAARVVQAIAGGASLWLFSRVLEQLGFARQLAALFALSLLLQPGFLDVHLMMWSEPLFLVLVLLDLLALQALLRFPERWDYCLALGLACGVAIIIRYAGAYLIPLNIVAIVCFSGNRDWRRRMLAAAAATGVGLLPLFVWLGFNRYRGSAGTGRVLAWHPLSEQDFAELARTVADWFHLPGGFGLPIALLLALAVLVGLLPNRSDNADATLMRRVLALNVLFYLAFLWASISLFDNSTPLDYRILFPIFPFCMASSALVLGRTSLIPRMARMVLALSLIAIICAGSYAGWLHWRHSRAEGNYLSSRGFQEMPVLQLLRSVPAGLVVATNGPELFEIYLRRDALMLPEKFSPTSRLAQTDYRSALNETMARSDLVVYFRPMARRTYLPTPDEIGGFPALAKVYEGEDAIVWVKVPAKPSDKH
jgi:4-amino-4-deoxy-L-arabinose transferase-like glycosyltransferase